MVIITLVSNFRLALESNVVYTLNCIPSCPFYWVIVLEFSLSRWYMLGADVHHIPFVAAVLHRHADPSVARQKKIDWFFD
jgi:hypothetical protein